MISTIRGDFFRTMEFICSMAARSGRMTGQHAPGGDGE